MCWSAGVECTGPDLDGAFSGCVAADKGVLHPTSRYLEYYRDELIDALGKQVVMLGVLGVPPVTEQAPRPPYEPIAGGVLDLVHREWVDGYFPQGDLIAGDVGDAADQAFRAGIGPGCLVDDGAGGVLRGLPPVRIREVCEGLEEGDRWACCIGSICAPDFSHVFECMVPWENFIIDGTD